MSDQPTPDDTPLACRLRELRGRADLTNKQIADQLEVSATAVGKWMKGTSRPDPERIPALTNILDADEGELLALLAGEEPGHGLEARVVRLEERMDEAAELLSRILDSPPGGDGADG